MMTEYKRIAKCRVVFTYYCLDMAYRRYLADKLAEARGNIVCVKIKVFSQYIGYEYGVKDRKWLSWLNDVLGKYAEAEVHLGRKRTVCYDVKKLRELLNEKLTEEHNGAG